MLFRANDFDPFKDNYVTEDDLAALDITPQQLLTAFKLTMEQLEKRAAEPATKVADPYDHKCEAVDHISPAMAAQAAWMFRKHVDILEADGEESYQLFRKTAATIVVFEQRHFLDVGWEIGGELLPPLLLMRRNLERAKVAVAVECLKAA